MANVRLAADTQTDTDQVVSAYLSYAYQECLTQVSMSRTSNYYENAVMAFTIAAAGAALGALSPEQFEHHFFLGVQLRPPFFRGNIIVWSTP